MLYFGAAHLRPLYYADLLLWLPPDFALGFEDGWLGPLPVVLIEIVTASEVNHVYSFTAPGRHICPHK